MCCAYVVYAVQASTLWTVFIQFPVQILFHFYPEYFQWSNQCQQCKLKFVRICKQYFLSPWFCLGPCLMLHWLILLMVHRPILLLSHWCIKMCTIIMATSTLDILFNFVFIIFFIFCGMRYSCIAVNSFISVYTGETFSAVSSLCKLCQVSS